MAPGSGDVARRHRHVTEQLSSTGDQNRRPTSGSGDSDDIIIPGDERRVVFPRDEHDDLLQVKTVGGEIYFILGLYSHDYVLRKPIVVGGTPKMSVPNRKSLYCKHVNFWVLLCMQIIPYQEYPETL